MCGHEQIQVKSITVYGIREKHKKTMTWTKMPLSQLESKSGHFVACKKHWRSLVGVTKRFFSKWSWSSGWPRPLCYFSRSTVTTGVCCSRSCLQYNYRTSGTKQTTIVTVPRSLPPLYNILNGSFLKGKSLRMKEISARPQ